MRSARCPRPSHEGGGEPLDDAPHAWPIATLPAVLGGLGLQSAQRTAPAAYWAAWADALPVMRARAPDLAGRCREALEGGAGRDAPCPSLPRSSSLASPWAAGSCPAQSSNRQMFWPCGTIHRLVKCRWLVVHLGAWDRLTEQIEQECRPHPISARKFSGAWLGTDAGWGAPGRSKSKPNTPNKASHAYKQKIGSIPFPAHSHEEPESYEAAGLLLGRVKTFRNELETLTSSQ